MLSEIGVAIGQINIHTLAPETNLGKILNFMEQIKKSNSEIDLVVFPESANIGYIEEFDESIRVECLSKSEDLSGPFISAIRSKAERLSLHVVIGMSRLGDAKSRDTLHNSAVLIGSEGHILGVYDKIHLFQEEKKLFEPGCTISVHDSPLARIGMSICYDMSFPEISRILVLMGANLICSLFNGRNDKPYKSNRIEYLARARAYENNVFVILANRVGTGKETPFVGHSIITAPNGEIISRSLSTKEEIVYGVITRQSLIDEKNENFVLKDRKPDLYHRIIQSG